MTDDSDKSFQIVQFRADLRGYLRLRSEQVQPDLRCRW